MEIGPPVLEKKIFVCLFVCSGPDTFTRYHTQSHYTGTGATSPSPTPKIRVPSGEQLVPLLTTLVCRGPGLNPVPPDLGADTLPTELPRPVKRRRFLSDFYHIGARRPSWSCDIYFAIKLEMPLHKEAPHKIST